jgi:hypothetical protein
MYPEIYVTPLVVPDKGEKQNEQVPEAGNSISICILGLGFEIDLSWVPKIPDLKIPGIEIPSLSIGDCLQLKIVDSAREDVKKMQLGQKYYLRIRIEYEHSMGNSPGDDDNKPKKPQSPFRLVSDGPGLESITFIVGVELGFIYSEHDATGIRYPAVNSFNPYEIGIKIKIRIKSYTNPGTFVLDIITGGTASLTPGVSTAMDILFYGLRAIGFDVGVGLYLLIEATAIFTPHFKLIFKVYPLGQLWAKIELDFWFFTFTILDVGLNLVLPIGLTVGVDSSTSPWKVYLEFWIMIGGSLTLFEIELFDFNWTIRLIRIYISGGSRAAIPAG